MNVCQVFTKNTIYLLWSFTAEFHSHLSSVNSVMLCNFVVSFMITSIQNKSRLQKSWIVYANCLFELGSLEGPKLFQSVQ